jgi:Protein of unknown function (DUF1573).
MSDFTKKCLLKQLLPIFLLFALLLLSFSCKNNARRSEAEKIVSEWVGKTIRIPDGIPCSFKGKDTLYSPLNTPYKIFVYIDSAGCTGCKAQFYKWNPVIEEIALKLSDKVDLQFVIHPKDEKDLQFQFRRDNFIYPVFLDRTNEADKLNHFPQETLYQCFLLDDKNKVLLIGNPILNPQIWELYKQVISGETDNLSEKKNTPLTTIEIQQSEIEVQDLKVGKESLLVFTLKNTGETPLLIQNVSASCGCTVPAWDKHPVEPGKEAKIQVKVVPENTGYFNKTIQVSCNTGESEIRLRVKGMAGL